MQRNFMAGQEFSDIHCANQQLQHRVREVAGVRDHGTTHQAPLSLFKEFEQAALIDLPVEPFSLCEIRTAKVHPDCHVVVSGSFYSAPYTYVGQNWMFTCEKEWLSFIRGKHWWLPTYAASSRASGKPVWNIIQSTKQPIYSVPPTFAASSLLASARLPAM